MEVALPFAQVRADEDQPLLRIILVCLFVAASMLVPACIEVAGRGVQSMRRFLARSGLWRRPTSQCEQQAAWDASFREDPCPQCGEGADACECRWPFCRHPLRDYPGWLLEEKLRLALTHPAPEIRMLAAEWLGESGDASALSAFRGRLATEADPRVLVEIICAAARIGGNDAKRLIASLKAHRSATVCDVANRCWEMVAVEKDRRDTGEDTASRISPPAY